MEAGNRFIPAQIHLVPLAPNLLSFPAVVVSAPPASPIRRCRIARRSRNHGNLSAPQKIPISGRIGEGPRRMAAVPQPQYQLESPEPDRRFLRPNPPMPRPTPAPPIAPIARWEPRWTERLWVTLACLALKPFSRLHRCKYCWRGRLRAAVGHQPDHLVVLHVCPVCDAARPAPSWLQPASRRKHLSA